jgi:hypothetical protein
VGLLISVENKHTLAVLYVSITGKADEEFHETEEQRFAIS